jgi:hypothetical protein
VTALAAYHPHVGIGLEEVGEDEKPARWRAATRAILAALDCRTADVALHWEATAIASGADIPEPREVIDLAVSLPRELTERHPELAGRPLMVRTLRLDDMIVATTFCEPARV